ncbi:amiloride-sensitive sodium channel subunit gamma [Elysia marginata]|uniref:Amiloride-sensitive sodium channel subunit gamma n=1 Tax=Elysia marginata TaxID=1093978 RepID=A0AAV4IZ17_9GAST|nr:amiloride-sensitive sodium channel subunit gamma [Elysia marginata]
MVGHLYLLIDEFYEYDTHSTVTLGFSTLTFPAVTICNVNPVKQSRMYMATPELRALVEAVQPSNIAGSMEEERNRKNPPDSAGSQPPADNSQALPGQPPDTQTGSQQTNTGRKQQSSGGTGTQQSSSGLQSQTTLITLTAKSTTTKETTTSEAEMTPPAVKDTTSKVGPAPEITSPAEPKNHDSSDSLELTVSYTTTAGTALTSSPDEPVIVTPERQQEKLTEIPQIPTATTLLTTSKVPLVESTKPLVVTHTAEEVPEDITEASGTTAQSPTQSTVSSDSKTATFDQADYTTTSSSASEQSPLQSLTPSQTSREETTSSSAATTIGKQSSTNTLRDINTATTNTERNSDSATSNTLRDSNTATTSTERNSDSATSNTLRDSNTASQQNQNRPINNRNQEDKDTSNNQRTSSYGQSGNNRRRRSLTEIHEEKIHRRYKRFIEGFSIEESNTRKVDDEDIGGVSGNKSAIRAIEDEFRFLYSTMGRTERYEMGHDIDNLLMECTFRGITCTADQFRLVQTAQYGNCYTLENKRYISTVGGPDDGLTLYLFMEDDEYLHGITNSMGYQVHIHNIGELPNPYSEGLSVSAGMETFIGLKKVNIERQGHPYGTCIENEDFKDLYNITYTQRTCQAFCLQKKIVEECKCFDSENDVIFKSLADAKVITLPGLNSSGYGPCKTLTESQCYQLQIKRFQNQEFSCDCPSPCKESLYTKALSSKIWPTEEYAGILVEYLCAQVNETSCEAYKQKTRSEIA